MRAVFSFRVWKRHPALIAGGVLAVGFAVVANSHGQTARIPTVRPVAPRLNTAIIASHPLTAGAIIGPGDVEIASLKSPLPPGAIFSKDDVLGRVTGKRYAAGAILSRDDLQDASALGIAAHVPPGERAFSIRVTEDEIVGGFLQSGNRVDVFATIPSSAFPNKGTMDNSDRSRAIALLQDVLVLAVGENPETRGTVQTEARTVSLSLAPDALARLALAQRIGKVSLAIRKPGDDTKTEAATATLSDLVPASPQSSMPASRSKDATHIPFYSGARTTSLSLSGIER